MSLEQTNAVEDLMMDTKLRSLADINEAVGFDAREACATLFREGVLSKALASGHIFYQMEVEHAAALKMFKDGNL